MERRRPDPQHIILTNARLFEISPETLLGPSRVPSVVAARGEVQTQLRERGFTFKEIGELTGGRHHTTVMHNVRRVLASREPLFVDQGVMLDQAQSYLQEQFPGARLGNGSSESAVPKHALIRHLVIDLGVTPNTVSRILNIPPSSIGAALRKDPEVFNQQVLKWKKGEQSRLRREERRKQKEQKEAKARKRDLFVAKAFEVVAAHYSLNSSDEMLSRTRTKRLVHPRQTFMYILFQHTDLSLTEIANKLGRKDHTVTLNAIRAVERVLEDNYDDLGERIEGLVEEINTQVDDLLK